MKELKISISDELYEELSTVPDKDSFLIELLENKLKTSAKDNAGSVECADEPCFEEPKDIAEITEDVPDGETENDDLAVEITDSGDICEEIPDPGDTSEYIPEDACFELEDFLEEKDIIADDTEDKFTLCCNCSLVDPDDLDECKEPVLDVDFADPVVEVSKSVPELMGSTEKEKSSSTENMACFESIIVDLTDRICELEKQIVDMSANVQFLKESSILSDREDDKSKQETPSPLTLGNIVAERPGESVPYATLSFPELKIPPELLHDVAVPVAEIEQDDAMENSIESSSLDIAKAAVDDEGSSFPEPFSTPSLFNVDMSPLTPADTPELVTEGQSPSFLQDEKIANGTIENDVSGKLPLTAKPEAPVPDVNVPPTDKLESCIFAYLPSSSEVKKDVIKSLLSKRYLDDEVESKIDQLLSDGKISNIVKDDRVYLMKLPENESA